MADVYMHSRMSEDVIKKLNYGFIKDLVYLGAQGPDPMYYNAFSKDHKEYRFIADRMHDTNTRMLLSNMVSHVKHNLNHENYSHLVGFICHYALDVKIHPYVYYNVGKYDVNVPETHQYRGLHMKFERSMDAVLIEKETKKKANKLKFHKTVFPVKVSPLEVMKTFDYALKQSFGKDNGGVMYLIATQKMYKNMKVFVYDPLGIKKQLYKIFDLFNKGDMFYTDLSFFNHIENYDYLNEQKNTWHHPVTNEAYNFSVMELYDQAIEFALKIIRKINPYIFNDKSIDLDTVFTNLSFNSGLACDHHDKLKYFNNYRK